MPNGQTGFISRSTCFQLGGDIREAWRDSEIAIDDLAAGREYEHVTTHLVHVSQTLQRLWQKIQHYAPHFQTSFTSLDEQITQVIRITLDAPDTAISRQNLVLHVREIQERMKRMGIKTSHICS